MQKQNVPPTPVASPTHAMALLTERLMPDPIPIVSPYGNTRNSKIAFVYSSTSPPRALPRAHQPHLRSGANYLASTGSARPEPQAEALSESKGGGWGPWAWPWRRDVVLLLMLLPDLSYLRQIGHGLIMPLTKPLRFLDLQGVLATLNPLQCMEFRSGQ